MDYQTVRSCNPMLESEPRFFFIEIHAPPLVLGQHVILSEARRLRRISRYFPKRMMRFLPAAAGLGMTKAR
jgi:hypothetical protein